MSPELSNLMSTLLVCLLNVKRSQTLPEAKEQAIYAASNIEAYLSKNADPETVKAITENAEAVSAAASLFV